MGEFGIEASLECGQNLDWQRGEVNAFQFLLNTERLRAWESEKSVLFISSPLSIQSQLFFFLSLYFY